MADGGQKRSTTDSPEIAIIGAGLAGLGMGIKFKQAGIKSFTIFDKSDGVGGTWRENTYPGVACDVPSHLYSYSFAPNPNWSKFFSPGAEIQAHTERVVDDHGLMAHTELGMQLVKAEHKDGKWTLTFKNGSIRRADFLINAVGGLHVPSFPDVEGRDLFGGTGFHTAQWRHDYDLTGKKVAVIGTAASALQLIPEIVDQVAELTVFQRTPNWVMPRMDDEYSEAQQKRYSKFSLLRMLHRLMIYLSYEMRFPAFKNNKWAQKLFQSRALKHMEDQIADAGLRAKLTPDYPIGCKRILASNVYFPALQKENVKLITDAVTLIEKNGIRDATGTLHTVDTIIYATGFKPFSLLENLEIIGPSGISMQHQFDKTGVKAHRAVSVPGFPNFAMLGGPNSGLGHNSIIVMLEAQFKYIIGCLNLMRQREAKLLDVKPQSEAEFDKRVQDGLQSTVWHTGCKSWYLDKNGRNYTLWYSSTLAYRRLMRRVDPNDFSFS